MTVMDDSTVEHVYSPRGGADDFFDCREPEVLLDGPAGTGKSRAILEVMVRDAMRYPESRQALVRKTRVSLTDSALVTFETKVLGGGLDSTYLKTPLSAGATRAHRHSYEFINGSIIDCHGMDNPTRLFSTEYDRAWVQEATELAEDEWESLHRALRNGKFVDEGGQPWHQLVGDCNPDSELHWLNQRCLTCAKCNNAESECRCAAFSPRTKRILSRHRDNPSLTAEYLERLSNLTGVRRKRLFEGIWCSAEGAIWENFDLSFHVIEATLQRGDPERAEDERKWYLDVPSWERRIKIDWVFASVDWGWRDPGVIQVWGVDTHGVMYRLKEVYRINWNINQWADEACELQKTYDIQRFTCDPSRPENISVFNKRMAEQGGLYLGKPELAAKAQNSIEAGLSVVRERLDKRSMFFVRSGQDCDPELKKLHQPVCTEEEIPAYVFEESKDGRPNRDRPAAGQADHGCFPAGTMVRMADGGEKDICEVSIGDMVATPHGPRRVVDAALTGVDRSLCRLTTNDGTTLDATPDHPVWTDGGWQPILSLSPGMRIAVCGRTTEAPSGTLGADAIAISDGVPKREAITNGCIGVSTKTTSVRFQKGGMFTTRTATPSTTTPSIWRRCRQVFILASDIQKIWKRRRRPQRRGIHLPRGSNGIDRTPSSVGLGTRPTVAASATSAGHRSRRGPVIRGSVPTHAGPPTVEQVASMTRRAPVSGAVSSFESTNTLRPDIALAPVCSVHVAAERADVYNLTVEGEHVFFANGVLVSNCDTLRYAAMFLDDHDWRTRPKEEPPAPMSAAAIMRHHEINFR